MKMTGARAIIAVLLEQGVDTVFGYPGGSVLNIYDALYQYGGKINHILTAHEQGAAHAADGYARVTGKTGVVIATSGPGATNLVTGIANAYMDSIPLVAITGNVPVPSLGRDSFQEIDITGVTMPITKHNFIVKDINDLVPTLRAAFKIASSGRKGPVLVDVTKDVTGAETEYTPAPPVKPLETKPAKISALERAAEIIKEAKKPLFYIGGGLISSNASPELLKLAEKVQIPVTSSMMGLGGFPYDNPLYMGLIGMHGRFVANKAAHDCDVLITAGARFSDRVAGNRAMFAPNAKIIHIDIDPAEMDKNVFSHCHVRGDLKQVLGALYDMLPEANHDQWIKELSEIKKPYKRVDFEGYVNPMDIITTIDKLTPDDTIIATDVGQHQLWAAQYYNFRLPRTLVTSGGLGTMGFGLGAAIGAQMGQKDKQVVLITGDGSFHMNLNEMTTLASYNIPVVIVLMNNEVLGMVRQWQTVFYGRRYSQTDPHRKTDFVKLAEAFGINGMKIEKPEDIEPVIKKALDLHGPVLIDCRIAHDASVLPMIPPGGAVQDTIDEMCY